MKIGFENNKTIILSNSLKSKILKYMFCKFILNEMSIILEKMKGKIDSNDLQCKKFFMIALILCFLL